MVRTLAPVSLLALGLLAPRPAAAFCGFYVSGADAELYANATMVVMMREGTRTVLSMQNSYKGPPADFALVVPVPVVVGEENVKTLPSEIFKRVDALAAPRLVEYWEQDPCRIMPVPMPMSTSVRRSGGGATSKSAPGDQDLGVTVEARFAVGEYEIVLLSAKQAGGLDTWLRQNQYNIPKGAEQVLRPYVEQGTKFFVAKVDPAKVKFVDGEALLSPLRVHYDTEDFNLPVRLGLLNSGGEQDLLVHILAKGQRYEVANYKNATIPTNIQVEDAVRNQYGSFYDALYRKTVEEHKETVVTEYAWTAGSCDPCPTQPLNGAEIATLGGDLFPGSNPSQYVLTRLHYRYGKDGLDEDLVFKAAPPIVGGRGMPDEKGELAEQRSTPSGVNNFQGRYVILHPWTGELACESPRRGMWGGPPGGGGNQPIAAPRATGTPKEARALASLVAEDIPWIGLVRDADAAPPPIEEAAPTEVAPEAVPPPLPDDPGEEPDPRCASVPLGTGWGLALGALALVALRRRKYM